MVSINAYLAITNTKYCSVIIHPVKTQQHLTSLFPKFDIKFIKCSVKKR